MVTAHLKDVEGLLFCLALFLIFACEGTPRLISVGEKETKAWRGRDETRRAWYEM